MISIYMISEKESRAIQVFKLWMVLGVIFIHASYNYIAFTDSVSILATPVWLETLKYVISETVTRCAVPAFFLLAAIFLFRKPFTWKVNTAKKIRTLLVPYLVINLLWIAFYFVCQHVGPLSVYFANNIISEWTAYDWIANLTACRSGYPLVYPLWFLRDLFLLNLIAPAIKRLIDRFPKIVFVLLIALQVTGVVVRTANVSVFNENDSLALVYFCLGYYCVKYGLHFSDASKWSLWKISLLYAAAIVLRFLTRDIFIVSNVFYFCACVLGVFFFAACAMRLKEGKAFRFISWMASYSFSIYLFHEMTMLIIRKLMTRMLPGTVLFQTVQYLALPFIMIVICLIISLFLKKVIPPFYWLITGGRQR